MNTERDIAHISTLLEATNTCSSLPNKRRVKVLENNKSLQPTSQSNAKQ